MTEVRDPSSCSSYLTASIKHYHLAVDVDFTQKKLKCAITLILTALQNDCSTVVSLTVKGLVLASNNTCQRPTSLGFF